MKKWALISIAILGWLLFLTNVLAANWFSDSPQNNQSWFSSISWSEQVAILDESIACTLTTEELMDRKNALQKTVFSKVVRQEDVADGMIFYFDDEEGLLEDIMEFVSKEKQCCPFFGYNLAIQPFGKGIGLKVKGTEKVKQFLKDNLADVSG